MELRLKNVGKINTATIEINGITVIVGENNTGKSTIARVLYCLLIASHSIDEKISNERAMGVYQELCGIVERRNLGNLTCDRFLDFHEQICENRNHYLENPDDLKRLIDNAYESINNSLSIRRHDIVNSVFDRILPILKKPDSTMKLDALKSVFAAEFYGLIGNISSDGSKSSMSLKTDNGDSVAVQIADEDSIILESSANFRFGTIYIDGSAALDVLDNDFMMCPEHMLNHNDHLADILVRRLYEEKPTESVKAPDFEMELKTLNAECDGELVRTEDGYPYVSPKHKNPLPLNCLSDGLRTLLILKTLLTNKSIGAGDVIILDNPENYLHPDWQLLFIEVIVMLQKKLGIRVLVNTHSIFVVRAIEAYSEKADINHKCRFYMAKTIGEQTGIADVTNCIDNIYAEFLRVLESI